MHLSAFFNKSSRQHTSLHTSPGGNHPLRRTARGEARQGWTSPRFHRCSPAAQAPLMPTAKGTLNLKNADKVKSLVTHDHWETSDSVTRWQAGSGHAVIDRSACGPSEANSVHLTHMTATAGPPLFMCAKGHTREEVNRHFLCS